jgi:hypothetical protein
MKIDDAAMISFVQNKAFLLKKVADQADSSLGKGGLNAPDLNQDTSEASSGVLLGLKIPSAEVTLPDALGGCRPSTAPRGTDGRTAFFPRASGFWELGVEEIINDGRTANLLTARNVEIKEHEATDGSSTFQVLKRAWILKCPGLREQDRAARHRREKGKDAEKREDAGKETEPAVTVIDYVGNDYVAGKKRNRRHEFLQVLPVDKLSSRTGIKISDLLGYKGLIAYQSARTKAAADVRSQEKEAAIMDEREPGKISDLCAKTGIGTWWGESITKMRARPPGRTSNSISFRRPIGFFMIPWP